MGNNKNKNKNTGTEKLTDAEKKKIKQANKAKANPALAAAKALKNDAKRERRAEEGTTKTFS